MDSQDRYLEYLTKKNNIKKLHIDFRYIEINSVNTKSMTEYKVKSIKFRKKST